MIEINKHTNLAGIVVLYDSEFYAVLQGSFRRSYLFDDYLLQVEKAEFPVSEIFASKCEIVEVKKDAQRLK
jgi:hypothetical protein